MTLDPRPHWLDDDDDDDDDDEPRENGRKSEGLGLPESAAIDRLKRAQRAAAA